MTSIDITANGDKAIAPNKNDTLLDYFVNVVRTTPYDDIYDKFEKAFIESPLYAARAMFFKRDIRGGAGEKDVFIHSLLYLAENNPTVFQQLIKYIPEYGCYKDLLKIYEFCTETQEHQIEELFANDLKKETTLASKWIPNEHSHYDRKYPNFNKNVGNLLNIKGRKQYRKQIVEYRKKLKLVETSLCARRYNEIDYSQVPSRAGMIYSDAFRRHDSERYEQYLSNVKNGVEKMNVGTLMVNDVLKQIVISDGKNEELNVMWNKIVEEQKTFFDKTLIISDMSGSMTTNDYVYVSASLGLLCSQANNAEIMSFSESPFFYKFDEGISVFDRFQLMQKNGGLNTDLRKTFNSILERMKTDSTFNVERIVIISDMEFDQGILWDQSAFEYFKDLFEKSERTIPKIVYWNVASRDLFPVDFSEKGVMMIGGYSQNLLKHVLNNNIPNPYDSMMDILNSERYSNITLEENIAPPPPPLGSGCIIS